MWADNKSEKGVVKHIYFVRHGESGANSKKLHQAPDEPLSEKGREQAKILAGRIAKIPVDVVISSTMHRAEVTAGAISEVINKNIETSDLFREIRRPSFLVGRSYDDPDVLEASKIADSPETGEEYLHSDEESLRDIKKRATEALDYLGKRPEQNILVVTHGMFLRVLLAMMLLGEGISKSAFVHFRSHLRTSNTGVTYCRYSEDSGWVLVTWNDHSHLG